MFVKIFKYTLLIFCVYNMVSCGPRPEPIMPMTSYIPILMSRTQIDNSILLKEPRTMNNPGKIYFKDNYIFINEKYKGIHIINNKDPKKPIKVGFILVPGCLDMAMKGSVLYVDNATDLLAIDLSDTMKAVVTKRVIDIFPELTPPDNRNIDAIYSKKNRPANTIIVGWTKK